MKIVNVKEAKILAGTSFLLPSSVLKINGNIFVWLSSAKIVDTPQIINMLPKIKFEIIVSDENWEKKTIEAIQKAAYTGHPGDGKIISYDLKSALRIRTGETGKEAIN